MTDGQGNARVDSGPTIPPVESESASSIHVDHRTDHSIITSFFQHIVRPFRPRLVKEDAEAEPGSPRLDIPSSASKKCQVHERKVDDIWLYDITQAVPESIAQKQPVGPKHHILYFAGGGWKAPPSPHHWKVIALMSQQLPHALITIVSYPLAPKSPAPVSFPKLMNLYRTLMATAEAQNERITLAGDSAGGNIILALTIEMLKQDPSSSMKPYSLMAICPSVQLDRSDPNPQIEQVDKHEPLLSVPFVNGTAAGWAGDWDKNDPRVSPLQADVSVLERAGIFVDGVTGGHDILAPDALLFRQKCAKAGVKGEWLEWDRQMHCWPLATTYKLFPESAGAWHWIVDILKKRGSGQ